MNLPATRIIKRYSNRKLYDTEQSRYITLHEISNLVQGGVDVKIIDNSTQEDLTGVTLAQILLDAEKRNERALPLSTLTEMLRSSGNRIQKSLGQQVSVIKEEAERTVVGIRKETERQFQDLKHRTNFEDVRTQLKDFVSQAQTNLDDLQTRVEERIRDITDEAAKKSSQATNDADSLAGDPEIRVDEASLTEQRIKDLEERVLSLEQLIVRLAQSPSTNSSKSKK